MLGGSYRRRRAAPRDVPTVELGALADGGLAPAILAIVERGVQRRPGLAGSLRAEIELELDERCPPVRVDFGADVILVEDGRAHAPDVRVQGTLPDLVSLMVAPLLGGLPTTARGRRRSALGIVAGRRVRVCGRVGLARRFLALIRV